jgi:F-type H+-transporting ATPase subunit a
MSGLLTGVSALVVSAESSIEIGQHVERTIGGVTFNMDTIWSTLIAGAIVVGLGLLARNRLTKEYADHVPSKLQLLWETIVKQVTTQVEDSLGSVNPFVVPLAVALFFFILIANWMELVPSEPNHLHLLPAPTADTNLTYALATLVIVGVWTYGIRTKGPKAYFKHFLEPFPILLPLNIIEELIKPLTLALRLFGNIFAGGIMLSLIGLIPIYLFWAPNIIWKLFDMFIGGIQAFIFALLTVLYFGMAGAGHSPDDQQEGPEEGSADERVTESRGVDGPNTDSDSTKEPALAR